MSYERGMDEAQVNTFLKFPWNAARDLFITDKERMTVAMMMSPMQLITFETREKTHIAWHSPYRSACLHNSWYVLEPWCPAWAFCPTDLSYSGTRSFAFALAICTSTLRSIRRNCPRDGWRGGLPLVVRRSSLRVRGRWSRHSHQSMGTMQYAVECKNVESVGGILTQNICVISPVYVILLHRTRSTPCHWPSLDFQSRKMCEKLAAT